MTQEPQSRRLANLPESITPAITWQEMLPVDVLSGLQSLTPEIKVSGRAITEPGRGVDITLKWAKDELVLAEQHSSNEERHASQAIIHAQCAVECLLDTYLERDWLTERSPSKPGITRKIELLSQRPALQLPDALMRGFVIEPRHDIIHRYETRTANDARVVVEAASSIIALLKTNSDPRAGPVFAGTMFRGFNFSTRNKHTRLWFTGFSDSFGLTWRGSDGIVRAAVGIVSNEAKAEVWWTSVREFSEKEHFELLNWWDSLRSPASMNEDILRKWLILAGLDVPPE